MCTVASTKYALAPQTDASISLYADMLGESSLLLSGLDTVELQALLILARRRPVKARKVVCKKGEPGHELFIVLSGNLIICISIALEDTHLLVIHRNDFLSFLEAHPKACMGLLMAMTQRLRKMDALIEDSRFLDLKDRLAKTLGQLTQEHGRTVAGGGVRIDFKISQEELGSLVGATRENVNKLIWALVEDGVLETSQSTLIIRQPNRLHS